MNRIIQLINQSITVKKEIIKNDIIISNIDKTSEIIIESLSKGGKVLFCGNGGSASDALHLTGEFVGRFQKERKAAAAVCLNADVASMTAIANDYGYEYVFSRVIEGLMQCGDILVGISTSGNSENIYQAALASKRCGGKVVAFLGKDGGKIKDVADIPIVIPSSCTARIQESHIMIGHIICELVEDKLK